MADFPNDTILVRYNTDNYGPFLFDFTDVIFEGDSLDSVTVRAFQGNVKATDDLDEETEVTALLDSDLPATISGNYVAVFFAYPGDAYKGLKFTLIFEITYTNNSGVHAYYFQYVKVE